MEQIVEVDGITFVNLCGHPVNFVFGQCCEKPRRFGQVTLKQGIEWQIARSFSLPGTPTPLNVVNSPSGPQVDVRGVPVVVRDYNANFDRDLNDLPAADAVIVSSVCRIAIINGMIFGNVFNGKAVDLAVLDRFYTPLASVIAEYVDSDGVKRKKIVGTTGLQKVTPLYDAGFYAGRIFYGGGSNCAVSALSVQFLLQQLAKSYPKHFLAADGRVATLTSYLNSRGISS